MAKAKKVILVVDHDEILRNGMRLILEADGHFVEEAAGGKEALAILSSQKFDMVVSEYQLPGMDGLHLLNHVKSRHPQILFILLSEFSPALQLRQAKQLGADDFLSKPFNRGDFEKLIFTTFAKQDAKNDDFPEVEFIQIPIAEFITGSQLKVDLFLQMSDKKYVKIGRRGDTLNQGQIETYMSKGVQWLFMRKQDFAIYVGFNIDIAQKAHSVDKIECARKLRLTMHVTETIIAQLRGAGLNRHQLEEASNVVINTVALIMTSPDTLKLLESMEMEGTLPAYSIATSIWTCLIAKQLGWKGHTTFFKVAICSLFHDIGTKELDEDLVRKPRFELTRQEIKLLESHTLRGRDILQSVPGMLNDVITVAVQHHELHRGGGYPYGLKFQQIHPLASLTGIADHFCEALKEVEHSGGLKAALEQISHHSRDFEPSYFKALTDIIHAAKAKSEVRIENLDMKRPA